MVFWGRIVQIIVLSLVIILVVIFFRDKVYFPYPRDIEQFNQTHEPIAGRGLVDRFIRALKIKTITRGNRDYDREALKEFARFLPEIIAFDRSLINDPSVEIEIKGVALEPHPISPYDSASFGFQTIKSSILQVFDNTFAIPGILMASTDTKWYLNFTKSVYRFSPTVLKPEDVKRFHGHNERISVDNYEKIVNFFHHIMLNSDKSSLDIEQIIVKDEL